jgi:hypothetical protein
MDDLEDLNAALVIGLAQKLLAKKPFPDRNLIHQSLVETAIKHPLVNSQLGQLGW